MYKIIKFWNGENPKTKLYQSERTFEQNWKYHTNRAWKEETFIAYKYINNHWRKIRQAKSTLQ